MKKQVEGHSSKQSPANRTTYFETLKFHISNSDASFDFTDIVKFERVYSSGREVSAYIERVGFTLRKGISDRTKMDETRNCGMIPVISQRHIGTWKRKDQPLTNEDFYKLCKAAASVSGNPWKEECNF